MIAENTRCERIPTELFKDVTEASRRVAREISGTIRQRAAEGKNCVLGLATGSTPKTVYAELIRMHKEEGLDFSNVITFNLDEYYPMSPMASQSYVRFMNEYLFDHIDIPPENVHIPDGTIGRDEIPSYCQTYEDKIREAGGIDIQLLGIGRTGHIGFNEPGSGMDSETRMIRLDHITISDAASDFFGEEHVPRRALTMGVKTILSARRILILAWGEGKAPIVKKAIEEEINDLVPATYLQKHSHVTAILDPSSSAELTRIKTPWLLGSVNRDEQMIRKGTIWLSGQLNKPILKLTDRDYASNGMSELVTEFDTAYNINLKVFHSLQRTITGYPAGKDEEKKTVLIFSPHPDDDVICMGGTMSRLVEHGHEVHVAYQTSGSIAVYDDDVIRYVDFVNHLQSELGLDKTSGHQLMDTVLEEIQQKKAGDIDSELVQDIKALIRQGEARAACRYVGVPAENLHFLKMPFYETGTIKKKPVGPEDVRIICDLLREHRPQQIYAAGDISDPHGTHRLSLTALLDAIEEVQADDWFARCRVWLYRGAWQEWETENIHMAVPLSPDELLRKRRAIFKHESQKDRPLFPGPDMREFWQRSESRNRQTAITYDALGLSEYEAIEAFREYTNRESI